MKGFDRKGWRKVKLGDVCTNMNLTEKNPLDKGIKNYIGLEHIESENLHVKAWGNIEEGTTFTKKFLKGQVLFGKRRAYLKKTAVAPFDGLCSGDILVLAPKEQAIEKKLFPFVVGSDSFFDFAVKTSAGSLSPRTKFQDLAKYEFLLPPKDKQGKLAELLGAGDELIEKGKRLSTSLNILRQVKFKEIYANRTLQWSDLRSCILKSQYGISEPLFEEGDIRVLRMNNLNAGKLNYEDVKYIQKNKLKNISDYLLQKGDILFNRTNSFDLVGKVSLFEEDMDTIFASYLVRLVVDKRIILPEYLNMYLNSFEGQNAIRLYRTPGVSQSNINPENLKKVKIPILSLSEQEKLVKQDKEIDTNIIATKRNSDRLSEIQKQLINQIFDVNGN